MLFLPESPTLLVLHFSQLVLRATFSLTRIATFDITFYRSTSIHLWGYSIFCISWPIKCPFRRPNTRVQCLNLRALRNDSPRTHSRASIKMSPRFPKQSTQRPVKIPFWSLSSWRSLGMLQAGRMLYLNSNTSRSTISKRKYTSFDVTRTTSRGL